MVRKLIFLNYFLNLPFEVKDTLGNVKARYHYDTQGRKLGVETANGDTLLYVGSFIYKKDATGSFNVESVDFGEGRFYAENGELKPHYFIKDHLGSVRAEWKKDNSGQVEILAKKDYYPYGLEWSSNNGGRYGYNGKENQKIAGLPDLDYVGRFIDPRLPRFRTIDSKAEKYYNYSPYVYTLGNPIKYIDPDGNEPLKISLSLKGSWGPQLGLKVSLLELEFSGVVQAYSTQGESSLSATYDREKGWDFTGNYESTDVYNRVEVDAGIVGVERTETKVPEAHPVFKETTVTTKEGFVESSETKDIDGKVTEKVEKVVPLKLGVEVNLLILGFGFELKIEGDYD